MQFLELTAAGTYLIKQSPGYLQGITINHPGTGPGTIQIFDQLSAAVPAIAGASAFALPAAGGFLTYDCTFSRGLTVVIGGTFTNGSVTVEFY
jgi:hypothetical protein